MKPGDLVRPRGRAYINFPMFGLILHQLEYYGTPHFMVLWGGEERLVEDGRDLELIE